MFFGFGPYFDPRFVVVNHPYIHKFTRINLLTQRFFIFMALDVYFSFRRVRCVRCRLPLYICVCACT